MEQGGGAPPTGLEGKRTSAACLFLTSLTQLARSGELSQLIRVLRACLLMFSASPATAAMEICCVWWTTKEEALAERYSNS